MILAVDPGKATGLAWATDYQLQAGTPPSVDSLGWHDAMDWVWEHRQVWDVIVCESYLITAQTLRKTRSSQNWAMEQIGILRWLAERQLHVAFVLQTPGNAKAFSTDAKLRWLDWWQAGPDHQMDAARHLLLYCIEQGVLDAKIFTKML